jgi:hypothetical protein
MDKQALAVMNTVQAVFFVGMGVLAQSAIGKANAHRIGGSPKALDDELRQHLLDMEADLTVMLQELSETQERLDFAERLLASHREEPRLGSVAGER